MSNCLICMKDSDEGKNVFEYFKEETFLCGNCLHKCIPFPHIYEYEGLRIKTLYIYNDFMESILFQFKEGKDIALKHIFYTLIKQKDFDKYKGYTIVYMPSSDIKNKERNFFALAEIYNHISLPKQNLLIKTKDIKQSLQTVENRKKIKNHIKLVKPLPTTPILLVDDVLTTGSTLISAYQLMKQHTYKIEAIVLCVHPRFVESCESFLFKKKRDSHILKLVRRCSL